MLSETPQSANPNVHTPLAAITLLGEEPFVLGREALMDSAELAGDRRAGIETIAVILGYRRTRRIGATVMLLSTVFLVGIESGIVGRAAALAMLLSLTNGHAPFLDSTPPDL